MPEISIILPVYNGEKYLRESIDSIIAQTYGDWELIIVDDCSNDSSPSIIDEYINRYDRIQVIHNATNMKLPESLNIGFRHARGKYFTWTSDDNIYESSALEEMKDCLVAHPSSPMVVADMCIVDEYGNYMFDGEMFVNEKMAYYNCVGACFMYRAEVVKSVGEYDSKWFLVEDYEYWLRIIKKYGNLVHLEKMLYRYRSHAESLTKMRRQKIIDNLNKLRIDNLDFLLKLSDDKEIYAVKLYCEMIQESALPDEKKIIFEEYFDIFKCIVPYKRGEKTVIYGAGVFGTAIGRMIDDVEYYVDRNPEKTGTRINGIEVISTKEIRELSKNYQIIVAMDVCNIYSAIKYLFEIGIHQVCIVQSIMADMGITHMQIND